MTWKCNSCGFDANEDGTTECAGGCGHVRMPLALTLTSEATGKEILMHLDTPVGRRMLTLTAGEEAVYASDPQFTISRNPDLGGWVVQHDASARNPTFLDGADLGSSARKLEAGAVLSIGPAKCRLRVQLAF